MSIFLQVGVFNNIQMRKNKREKSSKHTWIPSLMTDAFVDPCWRFRSSETKAAGDFLVGVKLYLAYTLNTASVALRLKFSLRMAETDLGNAARPLTAGAGTNVAAAWTVRTTARTVMVE